MNKNLKKDLKYNIFANIITEKGRWQQTLQNINNLKVYEDESATMKLAQLNSLSPNQLGLAS